MARNRRAPQRTVWEQADDLPRAGIPSTEVLARRQRRFRLAVWALLATLPLVALALIAAVGSLVGRGDTAQAAGVTDPGGRSAAMEAVTDWLGQDPAPVPGGRLVSWDSEEPLPTYEPKDTDSVDVVGSMPTLSAHYLTVRDDLDVVYRVEVLVATNPAGESASIGLPSLLPVAPSSGWESSVSPWLNLPSGVASDTVQTAVEEWVGAFTSGDPVKLRLAVGDPDESHSYMPLTGVADATVTVKAAAFLPDQDGNPTGQQVVQVQVSFEWAGLDEGPGGPVTYDLLVAGADSAAPRVVAWGGAGTGPVLTQYGNALVGQELVARATTPTRSPSASAQPTSQEPTETVAGG